MIRDREGIADRGDLSELQIDEPAVGYVRLLQKSDCSIAAQKREIRDNAPATTQEVANPVGVTRQGADYRLRKLKGDGLVSIEMLGNTLIWTVIDE